jgi:tRNA (guanine37-N1)-methyltransferase
MSKLKLDIITIFPDYFAPLNISLIGKAIQSGIIDLRTVNLRDFAPPPHHNVDDTPYGGGAGMVMKPDILAAAIDSVRQENSRLIFTTPAGQNFTQKWAKYLANVDADQIADQTEPVPEPEPEAEPVRHLIFVCGRFEGFDARVVEYYRSLLDEPISRNVYEFSIGDYVLNGGEVAAMVMIEAISRLIPGVIGNPESLVEESHEVNEDGENLLEYPAYTRPQNFRGLEVPSVLLSGNHQRITQWRQEQSAIRTRTSSTRPRSAPAPALLPAPTPCATPALCTPPTLSLPAPASSLPTPALLPAPAPMQTCIPPDLSKNKGAHKDA